MPYPTVSLRGLRKSFGRTEVLHGVDLDVPAGTVLAVLGENGAGKSTLMRIVAGDYRADAGEVRVDGVARELRDVATARRLGIRLINQEISDATTLSVAENISLGAWPTRNGLVSRRRMRDVARAVLDRLEVELPLDRPVSRLRLGERQLVEIARALVGAGRCLILDEPTAALSDAEAERLFEVIAGLRGQGIAVIYITHRLDEVFRVADQVCVLRDGKVVLREPVASLDRDRVVRAMIGTTVARRDRSRTGGATGPTRIKLTRASSGETFVDVDLAARAGEVVALYGKVGSGAAELAEALFGIRRLTAGEMSLDGRRVRFTHPADAIRAGIGCVPGERQSQAIFRQRSVAENLSAPGWGRLARGRVVITGSAEARAYRHWHDALKVRSRNDPTQPMWTLSGGNQQKIVIGRWLQQQSRVMVLVEPARGVDVGARQEIYAAIRELAGRGSAVVIASSDYEDVVEIADRALVLARGRVVAELAGNDITTDALTGAAGGAHDDR